jgi:hypothetical protein
MPLRRAGSEKKGGGRKAAMEQQPQLENNFLRILAEFTAGDPMREGVLWTHLSRREISRRLAELGTPASRHTVRQLMRKHGLGQRKVRQKKSLGAHPDRDAQFQNIARLKADYQAEGDPVIRIDSKKKELIGNFAREGHTHTQAPADALDHDFPSAGEGKRIPHGIYDLARNEGYLHLNTSHDTSELCCDSIARWWERHGRQHYPNTRRLLLLCDGGGSNAANRHIFKEDRDWRIGWDWKSGWRTTRRTVPSTTPSSTGCFRTSPGPARAWCFTPSPLPNSSWKRRKPPRD